MVGKCIVFVLFSILLRCRALSHCVLFMFHKATNFFAIGVVFLNDIYYSVVIFFGHFFIIFSGWLEKPICDQKVTGSNP